jgi:hypothetical protein
LAQIAGQGEEHRRLEGCCHGLTRLYPSIQDDPVDGRDNPGPSKVAQESVEGGLGLSDLRDGTGLLRYRPVVGGPSRIEFCLGRHFTPAQLMDPGQATQVGLGLEQAGLGL